MRDPKYYLENPDQFSGRVVRRIEKKLGGILNTDLIFALSEAVDEELNDNWKWSP